MLHSRAPRQAMLERLPRRAGRRFISVSPMPRVDGGLELVTSDGALALNGCSAECTHSRASSACACAGSSARSSRAFWQASSTAARS